MHEDGDATGFVNEYRALFGDSDSHSVSSVQDALVKRGDWTPEGAAHLMMLARSYGSFMLRNAFALSVALGIEDGNLDL